MKKIFIFLFIVFLLSAVAAAFFIATFDANRYRPVIAQKVEDALGRPVELGKISLAWRGGLAVSFENFSILSEAQAPVFSIKKAYALLRLTPLLRGDFQLGAVGLESPHIEATRLPSGEVVVHGFEGSGKGAEKEEKAPALAGLLIDSIEIWNGSFKFHDQKQKPPATFLVESADIKIRDLSLTGPIEVKAKAAFLSDTQNTEIHAQVYPPFGGRPARLENGSLNFDLSAVSIPKLMAALPLLQQIGLREKPAGLLNAQTKSLVLDETAAENAALKLRFSNGRLAPAALGSPLENIQAELDYENSQLNIGRLELDFAGGHIQGSGSLQNPSAAADARFQIEGQGFDLSQLSAVQDPEAPRPSGILSFNFEGVSRGSDLTVLTQSLQGRGVIRVKDPVLKNMNVVREVLNRLSMIPGLVERLLSGLPQEYQSHLEARDTRFAPVEIPFTVAGGFIDLPQVQLLSESFAVGARGRVGMNGAVSAQGMLTLDPYLSQAFMGSVEELKFLADRDGRIQIPLIIQGVVPQIQVFPDVSYVGSKLATVKVQEWLGGMMEKKGEKQSGGSSGSQSWENLVGGFLGG